MKVGVIYEHPPLPSRFRLKLSTDNILIIIYLILPGSREEALGIKITYNEDTWCHQV